MLTLLLLLVMQEATPVEAERAFAAAAQKDGQWTAFRAWSTPDALMFTPKPVKAHDFLKDAKDPPQSIEWWPTESYISCDGATAANTGGWRRPDGSVGFFTTIWLRQPDGGWKWVLDHGDALDAARAAPEQPPVQHPDCSTPSQLAVVDMSMDEPKGTERGSGRSTDLSLQWVWQVRPNGARRVVVKLWDGKGYATAIEDRALPPPVK